jgi:chromosomal replication initiator protein
MILFISTNYWCINSLMMFFPGKSGTRCVFHIFNYLHQNGKQVIWLHKHLLICKILNNVYCRDSSGLSAELHQPDYENRISILKKYFVSRWCRNVWRNNEYVARNIKSNVQNLKEYHFVNCTIFSFKKKRSYKLTWQKVLSKICKNVNEKYPSIIFKKLLWLFPIRFRNLQSKTRKKDMWCKPGSWLCFAKIHQSILSKHRFTNSDRSCATVLHACKQ